MLIGYVSDERFAAVAGAMLEFRSEQDSHRVVEASSSIAGAVRVDLAPGKYHVIVGAAGFGTKISHVEVAAEPDHTPHHFRLLPNRLMGYMFPLSSVAGEFSEPRVHAPGEYERSLWRYGEQKEWICDLGVFDEHAPQANLQVSPDGDYTQSGIEWNRHGFQKVATQGSLAAPQRSGLYFLHLDGRDGEFFCCPWVVAPTRPEAKLAVVLSDLNWNAYNNFGGRSNYIHASCLPDQPTVNARLQLKNYTEREHRVYDSETYAPLSADRPNLFSHIDKDEQLDDFIRGRQGCHMASAEWRLLGWLERNGIAYDVYSESQLHSGVLPLDSYRAVALGPHPEYWSVTMYDRLKQWVFSEGGRLAYLGGNGLNCVAEVHDDHRVTYQNTHWSHSEPQRAPDGSLLQSRFHKLHESEANLLGVVFSFPGIMTAAPYRTVDASHWCFAGTQLTNGDLFGIESLHRRIPGGASGHETDKISVDSPNNAKLLAKGENPDGGGAELVHFETPSGGEVFSVGSICWIASLLVDRNVSQITANVLRRFTES